jgi:hypothetical protein
LALGKHPASVAANAAVVIPSCVGDCYGIDGFSPSSWEPQEEGMMNIAASFSLSKRLRFNRIQEKVNTPEGDAD